MATTRMTLDPSSPPELTGEERARAKRHGELSDDRIDTSDVPELDAAFFERPVKKQLTLRLDRDVVDRFRSQGQGYRSRMNAVLHAFYERHRMEAAATNACSESVSWVNAPTRWQRSCLARRSR